MSRLLKIMLGTMAFIAALSGKVLADVIDVPFDLSVSRSGGIGIVNLNIDDVLTDLSYQSGGRLVLRDSAGFIIGQIDSLNVEMHDPLSSLNFSVTAGSLPVLFTISSGDVPVGISGTVAYASAGLTLTDRNRNGGSLTGNYNGSAYRAEYDSSIYADLISSFTVQPFLSAIGNGSEGISSLPGTIGVMRSSFSFMLTPGDSAAGTSVYEIMRGPNIVVPDSGSTVRLLGFGLPAVFFFGGQLKRLREVYAEKFQS